MRKKVEFISDGRTPLVELSAAFFCILGSVRLRMIDFLRKTLTP